MNDDTMGAPTRRRRGWAVAAVILLVAAVILSWLGRGAFAVWWRERAVPRGQKPSVLLLTLDSVRADRLGGYGATPSETPRLDALCAAGVVFERAYTSAPLCLPAHATILTGLLPSRHGIRDDSGFALGDDVPTLAEALRGAGYRTAAFVADTDLEGGTGLARGFELYGDDLGAAGKTPGRHERAAASEVVYRALTWLEEGAPGPIFLWVHLADALAPFTPPQPVPPGFAERPYESQIATIDAEVGRLLDALRTRRPEAIVAVVGDHGTALGEHGETRHGYFLYGVTTRVPLVLSGPGLPKGLRIDPIVRTADLMPTLLDIAGLEISGAMDGTSVVPLIVGRSQEGPGPAAIETLSPREKYGMSPLFALRSGPYLYVRAPRPELYDVRQDPEETDDAISRLPRVGDSLDDTLRRLVPEAAEDLSSREDLKDRLELFDRYRAAGELDAAGERERAVDVYRSILSESPDFVFARRKLSETLNEQGRWAEARLALRELVDRGEANEATYLNLALAHYRLRQKKEALEWLGKGVAAEPRSAALHHRRGRLLLETGAAGEAEAELARAIELEPLFTDAHLARGDALVALGREDSARAAYRRCLKVAPVSPEADEARSALGRLGEGQ